MRWYGRLRRSSEIAFVRRRGRHASLPTLSAYAVAANADGACVAISVAKAVGPAVTRNRVRRRIRGVLDTLVPPAMPYRVLFIAKPAAAASYAGLARDVAAALEQLGGQASRAATPR